MPTQLEVLRRRASPAWLERLRSRLLPDRVAMLHRPERLVGMYVVATAGVAAIPAGLITIASSSLASLTEFAPTALLASILRVTSTHLARALAGIRVAWRDSAVTMPLRADGAARAVEQQPVNLPGGLRSQAGVSRNGADG